jgi:hypothetical protein
MAVHTSSNTDTRNKSEFIRSQPAGLSAADLVAKAKAEGLTIEPGLVYNVRGRAKSARKAKKSAKRVSPAKKAASKRPLSKADFVRQHASLSPKEIVAKAKAGGIELDVGYVYNVRSIGKAAGPSKATAKKASAPRSAPLPKSANARRPSSVASSNEEELLKIVAAEIGLGRALEILAGERARLMAIIGR